MNNIFSAFLHGEFGKIPVQSGVELLRVVFVQASNECIMYVSCMYHECIRNVSHM